MLHETGQRRRSAVLRAKRIPEETLAAAKILIQDGQLTISQISKRLGISVSTIYLRYPSARQQFGNPDPGPPGWVSPAQALLLEGELTVVEVATEHRNQSVDAIQLDSSRQAEFGTVKTACFHQSKTG